MMTAVTVLIFGILAFCAGVHATCRTSFAVHQAIQAPRNVLTFDDEGGFRELKAKAYNINNCQSDSTFITGKQYIGNYTLMGHTAGPDDGSCLIKTMNGESIYDSMQAVVIQTNGWVIEPQAIDLDDLDAQENVKSEDGWKESMAIFGVRKGTLVKPTLQLYEATLLKAKEYKVPRAAMEEMKLDLDDSYIPGGEYASAEMINCPFGRDNEDSKKCRMTAEFTSPVDTVVLLYAVAQKSKTDPNAAVFFSEILMDCGCRCQQVPTSGVRKLTSEIPGLPNECVQTDSVSPKTQCNLLGLKWCSKDIIPVYEVTGEKLPNGNFPCRPRQGQKVIITDDFSPRADFVLKEV